MEFSVLMSVYKKEKAQYLQEAIESVLNQTIKPNEVLILKDGLLTKELDETIQLFENKYPGLIKTISFDNNRGLGKTLKDGVELAKYDIIARMDSDDIAEKDRFELQINEFKNNPELDVVGGCVTEFIDKKENVVSYRKMPENNEEIYKYAHRRNPFAHPTIMFKKNKVIEAGNYRHCYLCEDYDLWIRMIRNGAKCYNLQKKLVNMRISEDFYKRRGGIKYFNSISKFKIRQYREGFYSFKDLIISCGSHLVICIIPNFIRKKVYMKFLRKTK